MSTIPRSPPDNAHESIKPSTGTAGQKSSTEGCSPYEILVMETHDSAEESGEVDKIEVEVIPPTPNLPDAANSQAEDSEERTAHLINHLAALSIPTESIEETRGSGRRKWREIDGRGVQFRIQ
ncbi:hypothetical protein NP233_g6632 [Leucocoprinus birnbaumii]|uniref:Uncharacterized protein n=1 Tax=Leucocoprinus birnbaumii TaxID=56174 RepID=A0AAD5YVC6_9AGAR|nr:hypothetical protein NP233_g6632 [Leucocoprinus birnbaumii]